MRRIRIGIAPLALAVLLPACEVSAGPDDDPAVGTRGMMASTEVDSIARDVRERFSRWFAAGAGDAATADSLYASDVIFSDEMEQTHRGLDGIRSAFSEMQPGSTIEIQSFGAVGSGDLIVDLGTYAIAFPTPDGQRMTARGRYMIALQRMTDGTWKVVRQLSSASLPGGGMPLDSLAATRDSAWPAGDSVATRDSAARRDSAAIR